MPFIKHHSKPNIAHQIIKDNGKHNKNHWTFVELLRHTRNYLVQLSCFPGIVLLFSHCVLFSDFMWKTVRLVHPCKCCSLCPTNHFPSQTHEAVTFSPQLPDSSVSYDAAKQMLLHFHICFCRTLIPKKPPNRYWSQWWVSCILSYI